MLISWREKMSNAILDTSFSRIKGDTGMKSAYCVSNHPRLVFAWVLFLVYVLLDLTHQHL